MCEVTAGYNNVCDSPGGVDTWYWFSTVDDNGASNIATNTVVAGAVTDFTLVAGKYAHVLNVEIETSSFTDTAIGDRTNNSTGRDQSASVVMHGNTAAMIAQLDEATKGRIGLVAKLTDGTYELLFRNNGAKVTDERTSGQAYEDMNGNTLTFVGKETAKAPKISSTIVNALLQAGS